MDTMARKEEKQEILTELGPNDVLLGRGTGPNENPGNIQYRELLKQTIEKFCDPLSGLSPALKARSVFQIVGGVQGIGGRFVRKLEREEVRMLACSNQLPANDSNAATKNFKGPLYLVVSDEIAKEKTKQSIRSFIRRDGSKKWKSKKKPPPASPTQGSHKRKSMDDESVTSVASPSNGRNCKKGKTMKIPPTSQASHEEKSKGNMQVHQSISQGNNNGKPLPTKIGTNVVADDKSRRGNRFASSSFHVAGKPASETSRTREEPHHTPLYGNRNEDYFQNSPTPQPDFNLSDPYTGCQQEAQQKRRASGNTVTNSPILQDHNREGRTRTGCNATSRVLESFVANVFPLSATERSSATNGGAAEISSTTAPSTRREGEQNQVNQDEQSKILMDLVLGLMSRNNSYTDIAAAISDFLAGKSAYSNSNGNSGSTCTTASSSSGARNMTEGNDAFIPQNNFNSSASQQRRRETDVPVLQEDVYRRLESSLSALLAANHTPPILSDHRRQRLQQQQPPSGLGQANDDFSLLEQYRMRILFGHQGDVQGGSRGQQQQETTLPPQETLAPRNRPLDPACSAVPVVGRSAEQGFSSLLNVILSSLMTSGMTGSGDTRMTPSQLFIGTAPMQASASSLEEEMRYLRALASTAPNRSASISVPSPIQNGTPNSVLRMIRQLEQNLERLKHSAAGMNIDANENSGSRQNTFPLLW